MSGSARSCAKRIPATSEHAALARCAPSKWIPGTQRGSVGGERQVFPFAWRYGGRKARRRTCERNRFGGRRRRAPSAATGRAAGSRHPGATGGAYGEGARATRGVERACIVVASPRRHTAVGTTRFANWRGSRRAREAVARAADELAGLGDVVEARAVAAAAADADERPLTGSRNAAGCASRPR